MENKYKECRLYEKENDYWGKCRNINMMIMVQNEIPEAEDFASQNQLMVREEFGCNLYEAT